MSGSIRPSRRIDITEVIATDSETTEETTRESTGAAGTSAAARCVCCCVPDPPARVASVSHLPFQVSSPSGVSVVRVCDCMGMQGHSGARSAPSTPSKNAMDARRAPPASASASIAARMVTRASPLPVLPLRSPPDERPRGEPRRGGERVPMAIATLRGARKTFVAHARVRERHGRGPLGGGGKVAHALDPTSPRDGDVEYEDIPNVDVDVSWRPRQRRRQDPPVENRASERDV